jgi:integral membrane protein (TIGR01906 family)
VAPPATPAAAPFRGRLASSVLSAAAALVILGVAIVPFLTPAWIHAEQDRSAAPAFLGAPPAEAHADADAIVHDLLVGGPFQVASTNGEPLLDPKEQAHMRDVRGVFQGLAILVLAGIAVLALAARQARTSAAAGQRWWAAVGRGARWLAVLMAVIGALSLVAFDAAFELFHELLFPTGSFSFDPATEHLVQLFPDQFWSDTALALGLVALVLAIAVAGIARRRAARLAHVASAPARAAGLTSRSVP